MEIWDVYDKDRKPTGKTAVRGGKLLGEGEYHLSVHICIFSTDGRMLIQQRSYDKATWSGLWDITAAGSVLSGETSAMGARRELSEELGLDRDFSTQRTRFTIDYENGFGDYYFLFEDLEPDELSFRDNEVRACRYATLEEILELLHTGNFIPYFESFIRFLFDMRLRYSTHDLSSSLMYNGLRANGAKPN